MDSRHDEMLRLRTMVKQENMENVPIQNLKLSIRAHNSALRNGLQTFGDFIEIPDGHDVILGMLRLGRIPYTEICQQIFAYINEAVHPGKEEISDNTCIISEIQRTDTDIEDFDFDFEEINLLADDDDF